MRYVIFHKPYDVLTQFTLPENVRGQDNPPRTLADFISIPGIYPVGRLDRDSEGLLLLTEDGALAARLIEPRYAHPRTYWVQVEGIPTPEALTTLAAGVVIQGQRTRPVVVQPLDPAPEVPPRQPPIRTRLHIPTSWLALTLTEGRNRQVRRMTAAVGYPTLRLMRVGLGSLMLDQLPAGEWRDLTAAEVAALYQLTAFFTATTKMRLNGKRR